MRYAIAALMLSICEPLLSIFYTKTDKVCDPTNSNLLAYTGFRIHREYIVNGLKSPIIHFNSISHCEKGVVDFERVITVGRDVDVEFNKPFCLLKPNYLEKDDNGNSDMAVKDGDFLKFDRGRLGGTIIRRQEEQQVYDFMEIQSLNMSIDQIDQKRVNASLNVVSNYGAKKYVMDFAQGLFAKLTTTKKIDEYIGRRKFLTMSDFEILTPPQLSLIDFEDDFVCYNMVRRKKYAKRKMGIYAPYRFVGGIFECSITVDDKNEIMDSYKRSLKTPAFKCDPQTSLPIAPLISDNISKQWFQIATGAHIMQRIPYLYTPTPKDLRFHDLLTSGNWYDELNVNEDYVYHPHEIGIVTKAITDTSNKLCKMLLSMERLTQNENERWVETMMKNLESRFSMSIGLANETELLTNLENLEEIWDSIEL